jgi:hypothetical protein
MSGTGGASINVKVAVHVEVRPAAFFAVYVTGTGAPRVNVEGAAVMVTAGSHGSVAVAFGGVGLVTTPPGGHVIFGGAVSSTTTFESQLDAPSVQCTVVVPRGKLAGALLVGVPAVPPHFVSTVGCGTVTDVFAPVQCVVAGSWQVSVAVPFAPALTWITQLALLPFASEAVHVTSVVPGATLVGAQVVVTDAPSHATAVMPSVGTLA